MSSYTRISKAFQGACRLPLCKNSKYIIFSDCHRGTGRANDNFLKRFLVRYIWRPLEILGIHDPTSAVKNNVIRNQTEKRLILIQEAAYLQPESPVLKLKTGVLL
jgi:hypothetical protein